ncbi:T9SS type A sorting domain-containing protein [Spirosoma sp.]|uniref:T9SS type A sorting domain-containing protein n=1 Tax=Spirosoma sp. TaxID=1899569 RepID=UPI003B3BA593
MKTLIQSLLIASSIGLISVTASMAAINPIGRPAHVASFKTGIYTTAEGKLHIALDKEKTGVVRLCLKSNAGETIFSQRIARKQTTTRIRLDMSDLKDGVYLVEVTNGVETTTQQITISTQQPSAPSRLVAIN